MTQTRTITVTEAELAETRNLFDAGETRKGVEAETPYYVSDSRLWGWSPDGVGMFWYDSLEDLVAEHG